MSQEVLNAVRDPIRFARWLWPNVDFFDKQQDIIRSVEADDETYCVAGNQLGV